MDIKRLLNLPYKIQNILEYLSYGDERRLKYMIFTGEQLKNYKTKHSKFSVFNNENCLPYALAFYHEYLEEVVQKFFNTEDEALEEYKRLKNGKFGQHIVDAKICHINRATSQSNGYFYGVMYYIET